MAIGEYINHYNAVRVSVLGTGTLKLTLLSPPDNQGVQASQSLTDINMNIVGHRTPTSLANFKDEAAQLKIFTEVKDDRFVINQIIIYVVPTDTSYPS